MHSFTCRVCNKPITLVNWPGGNKHDICPGCIKWLQERGDKLKAWLDAGDE